MNHYLESAATTAERLMHNDCCCQSGRTILRGLAAYRGEGVEYRGASSFSCAFIRMVAVVSHRNIQRICACYVYIYICTSKNT
jgi:hypothetical protein